MKETLTKIKIVNLPLIKICKHLVNQRDYKTIELISSPYIYMKYSIINAIPWF